MRSKLLVILPAVATLALMGCGENRTTPTTPGLETSGAKMALASESTEPTIYEIAKAASQGSEPEFTILVAALEATGLDAALDGKGQFTVFAPTDAAFGRLFANPGFPYTPGELLANKELLSKVLLYHVARGQRLAADVVESEQIRMMSRGFNYVELSEAGAFLRDTSSLTENAQIVATDIMAGNGVIHVIDEVLLP